MFKAVPSLALPFCGSCVTGLRTDRLRDAAAGGLSLLAAVAVLGLSILLWPWISPLAMIVGAAGGAVAALAGLRWFTVSSRLGARWIPSAPATWLSVGRAQATVAVCSRSLADELVTRAGGAVVATRNEIQIGTLSFVLLFAAIVVAPWLAERIAFTPLRVVLLSSDPLELFVDGRSLGIVVGVAQEDPSAVREYRVPRGTVVLEARRLDGSVVDRTVARVGEGAAQMYVPIRGDQCFWVEQRAYGQALPQAVRVRPIGGRSALVTIGEHVDAWFEATPSSGADSHWFSGGTRTAVRHAVCGVAPSTR